MLAEQSAHRPRYTRAEIPPALWFQERDGKILAALYRYDGMLARRHIKALFWSKASVRAMEMRLSLLYHQGYLDWPNREQRSTKPIPEPMCWLGWKGALCVASQQGLAVEYPKTINETQLRRLEKELRTRGLRWLREPRWSQLAHDIAVTDVRMAVEQAVSGLPNLTLEKWVGESAFRTVTDVVEFVVTVHSGTPKRKKRGVIPDGYFVILDTYRQRQGMPARARFLLEMDMGTHDTGSFFEEKILAGLAYLQSPAYKTRFGGNTGRWLVVTTSKARLTHLMRQAANVRADTFWFTTLGEVTATNPVTAPIWRQAPDGDYVALIGR